MSQSIGIWTLFNKEVLRFWKVAFQTIAAPILTAWLYMVIFGHVLQHHVQVYPGVSYVQFLVPGLVMMSVLQNAFANTSSSLIQSKITGNLIFILLAPISSWGWYVAYVMSAVVRGLCVGLGVLLMTWWVGRPPVEHWAWVMIFGFLGAALLGSLGMIAGLWAEKFDQLAAFQNFIILPLTFLSGVFYSVHSLPPLWQLMSHFNPFFYMIDGFRYGFFGYSDVSPWLSLSIIFIAWVGVMSITLYLLRIGYKIRR